MSGLEHRKNLTSFTKKLHQLGRLTSVELDRSPCYELFTQVDSLR